jgi:hypothetical protein
VYVTLRIEHAMHEPYCHLWPVRLYNVIPLFLINREIFVKKKKLIGHKIRVFTFYTAFALNISHYKKR